MCQGDEHDALPHTMYYSRWHGQWMGWSTSLTLGNEVRQEMSLPLIVYEYEDVFLDEILRLPP